MIDDYKLYVANETESADTRRLRYHFIDRLSADLDVATATQAQLEQWLHSHGWSPSSKNTARSAVRHFYSWAERYGYIPVNPSRWLTRVRVPRKMGRIAADERIRAAYQGATPSTRLMILLASECGLRRSEIARVHRTDIQGEWLYTIGKGGHQRMNHLSPEAMELLDGMPAQGWLFPSPTVEGHHITPGAVYERIQRAVGVNPHSLRHRAGTTVYKGTGNDLRVAQEFLGHANVGTTAKYVHVGGDDLARAGEAARLAA